MDNEELAMRAKTSDSRETMDRNLRNNDTRKKSDLGTRHRLGDFGRSDVKLLSAVGKECQTL